MAHTETSPEIQELLETIRQLESRLKFVEAKLDDLGNAFLKNLDHEDDKTARVFELLWALVDKTFPGFREMQDKLYAIVPPVSVDPAADNFRDTKPE